MFMCANNEPCSLECLRNHKANLSIFLTPVIIVRYEPFIIHTVLFSITQSGFTVRNRGGRRANSNKPKCFQ